MRSTRSIRSVEKLNRRTTGEAITDNTRIGVATVEAIRSALCNASCLGTKNSRGRSAFYYFGTQGRYAESV